MQRILIVDDDAELRRLTGEFLTRHGFSVALAANAVEMDQHLASEWPDLLVLDLMMPGEHGLSICRRLAGTRLPIIVLSAAGEVTDRGVGLELGADDYLPKPCSPRERLARVCMGYDPKLCTFKPQVSLQEGRLRASHRNKKMPGESLLPAFH